MIFIPLLCNSGEDHILRAKKAIEKGHFEIALRQFHALYQEYPRHPEVLANLGLLLSLESISLPAGINMLEESLRRRPNETVRQELVNIYIHLKQFKMAQRLAAPEQLGIAQIFSQQILNLRAGLECLQEPTSTRLKRFDRLKLHPRRSYYKFLCGLALHSKLGPKSRVDLQHLYKDIPQGKIRCQALAVWKSRNWSSPYKKRAPHRGDTDLQRCRQFPSGMIALQRADIQLMPAPPQQRPGSLLFDSNIYDPADPGPERRISYPSPSPPPSAPLAEEAKEEGRSRR